MEPGCKSIVYAAQPTKCLEPISFKIFEQSYAELHKMIKNQSPAMHNIDEKNVLKDIDMPRLPSHYM